MASRRLWRALVATVGIAALGVTTGVIGGRLATPAGIAAKTPTTELAPVLSPIGYGDDAPAADLDGESSTFEVSRPIGSREVVLRAGLEEEIDAGLAGDAPAEGRGPEPSSELLEAIETLDSADDPAAVIEGGAEAGLGSGPADDPCDRPGGGADRPECAGLRGTVLPFTGTPVPIDLGTRDESRPPARVIPFGQNLVYAMAPHNPESTLVIEGGVLEPGDAADCATVGALVSLEPVAEPGTREVSGSYLADNGYHPQYRMKTGQTFYAPEGATVLMCLSVFDIRRTSWEWDTASFQYSTVLQVPDVTLPRVTLESVEVNASLTEGHLWSGASQRNGRACGAGRAFNLETVSSSVAALGGVVLCEPYRADGMSEYLHGDIVVTTMVARAGERLTSNAVLPLSSIRCNGSCALPPTAWYRLSLATVEVGRGLCGGGIFDSCDPPTSQVSAGTATIRVDWVQGRSNGQAEWITGPVLESTPETPESDTPRMNIREELREVPDFHGTHIAFDLETDRPVRFQATLVGDYCAHPDSVTEVSGSSAGTTEVRFANLCRGSHYQVAVRLFDDADAVAGYAPGSWEADAPDFPVTIWAGGVIDTTPIEKRLMISYRVTDKDGPHDTTLLSPFAVTIGGERLDLESPYSSCVYGDYLARGGLTHDASLGDIVTITVEAGMRNGNGAAEVEGRYPQCVDADPDSGERMTFQVEVPIESITREGLRITAPEDSPYEFSMTILDWY